MSETQIQKGAKAILESPKAPKLMENIRLGFEQIALGLGFSKDTAIGGPGYKFHEILETLDLTPFTRCSSMVDGVIYDEYRVTVGSDKLSLFVRMDDPDSELMRGVMTQMAIKGVSPHDPKAVQQLAREVAAAKVGHSDSQGAGCLGMMLVAAIPILSVIRVLG